MIFAGLSVVFAQRRGDIMVHVETLAYGVDIVIGTPAFQSSFEQSVNKLFIVHIQPYDSVNFGAAFLEKCVKGFGLINGARKAIKDDSFGCFGVGVKLMLKDRNHEVVGDKMSLGNVAVGNFAKFGTLTYVATQNIACGDVVEPVLIDEACALSAFAAAGAPNITILYILLCGYDS